MKQIRKEITINASAERVWRILTDFALLIHLLNLAHTHLILVGTGEDASGSSVSMSDADSSWFRAKRRIAPTRLPEHYQETIRDIGCA